MSVPQSEMRPAAGGQPLLDLKQNVAERGVGCAVSADADGPDEHIGLRDTGGVRIAVYNDKAEALEAIGVSE
jgi:hypothetical protein